MKKAITIICVVLVLVLAAVGGFFAGRASVQEGDVPASGADYGSTFYATIEKIGDGWLQVEGLDVNDINHRGTFTLGIGEDTKLVWHYTELTVEELKVGQTVSITYTGPVLETYPVQITNTLRIELLDDDKDQALSVVDIVDRTVTEGLPTNDALEGFYSDEEYTYYFGSMKSGYVIVHYSDGTQEPVTDALASGRATLADLDRFGIGYGKEPRVTIVDIVDIEGPSDAEHQFFSDVEFQYYFPTLHDCTVYYSDGTQLPITEAFADFRVTLADLDRFGIDYWMYPLDTTAGTADSWDSVTLKTGLEGTEVPLTAEDVAQLHELIWRNVYFKDQDKEDTHTLYGGRFYEVEFVRDGFTCVWSIGENGVSIRHSSSSESFDYARDSHLLDALEQLVNGKG